MTPRIRRPAFLLILAFWPLLASAQIAFNFTYQDAGTGFNDAGLGATRRNALESAASTLGSYFSNYPARTVNLTVNASLTTGTGFLASAGSLSFVDPGTFQQGLVQQMILTGDNNGQASLGSVTWNFGYTWDYDDSIGGGAFDFKAVAMHELTHALGFASYLKVDGTGLGGSTWSAFDQFLTDVNGNRLVDAGGIYQGGAILTDAFGGDVYFSGANAMAANGGLRVHIYSPATFASGSSLSHLDTDFFGPNNYIMTHAVTTGQSVRTLSTIEVAMLQDIGYSMAAVPEPATCAFGAGVLVLFAAARRRSRPAAAG